MRYKAILLFALAVILCIAGCGRGGCNVDYCCIYGTPYTPFMVLYPGDGTYSGYIAGNGVGTFPKRGFPYCSSIPVLYGSNFGFDLFANPSSIDLNAPPASVTITGQGMDGTYGMPKAEYFDGNGVFIGSITATAVGSDGTWLQANTPDLSSVYSGNYQIRVTNMRSDGYYLDIVGTATVNAFGRDAPPPDDGGGDGGAECCGRGCYCY